MDGWSVDQEMVAEEAVIADALTPEMAGGVAGTLTGRTISTSVKFHWSFVGAVVESVMTDSTGPPPAVSRWVQKVSPTPVSTHWCTMLWPEPSVRATARSQSLPTAYTSDPARVAERVALDAPLGAEAPDVFPIPAAPRNATTVND